MKTVCKISIEVKLSKGAYAKASYFAGRAKAYGSEVYRLWQTFYQSFALARLRDLQARYDNYQARKHKEFLSQWPPHSIFCEKRCCQKSFRSYHAFLKKQLVWDAEGHIKS